MRNLTTIIKFFFALLGTAVLFIGAVSSGAVKNYEVCHSEKTFAQSSSSITMLVNGDEEWDSENFY